MNTNLTIAGLSLTIATIVLAVAAAQFVLVALSTLLSREKLPRTGIRSADRRLAISAAVLALTWTGVFSASTSAPKAAHAQASMAGTTVHDSCSSIEEGISADVTWTKLGKPDEVRPDEETRGPGAKIWIYRQSRCAVHMLDDQVEFID